MTISPVFGRDDPQLRAWFVGECAIMNQMIDDLNQRRESLKTLSNKLDSEHAALQEYREALDMRHEALRVWSKSLRSLSYVLYGGLGFVCCGAVVLAFATRRS